MGLLCAVIRRGRCGEPYPYNTQSVIARISVYALHHPPFEPLQPHSLTH